MSILTLAAFYPAKDGGERFASVQVQMDLLAIGGRKYLDAELATFAERILHDMKTHAPAAMPAEGKKS